jgi:hypothetical protein
LPVDILRDGGECDVPVVGLQLSAETGRGRVGSAFARGRVVLIDSPGRLHRHQRDERHAERLLQSSLFFVLNLLVQSGLFVRVKLSGINLTKTNRIKIKALIL